MKTRNEKNRFLNELREIPIVSVVCKRTGIGKTTIYRWLKNDTQFRVRYNEALAAGRDTVTDLCEGTLIAAIKKGSLRATEYWLGNNSKRYIKPRAPQPRNPDYKGITEFFTTIYNAGTQQKPVPYNGKVRREESKGKPPPEPEILE